MKLSRFIAQRYLFSRKRKSIITIISWISLIGLSVSAAALIVVLSVYNGIGGLTQKLFNVFDPELKVESKTGKSFAASNELLQNLNSIPGVKSVSCIVEENAWVTYRQNQAIVFLRGVDDNYPAITGIDTLIYDGEYILSDEELRHDENYGETLRTTNYAIAGALIYDQLGLRGLSNEPMAVHIPKRGKGIGLSLDDAFNTGYLYLSGTFYIQQDIDSKYILADINFVRNLLDYPDDECTSLAIALDGKKPKQTKAAIISLLGDDYLVKDRYEQQPLYYKIYRSERFGIILILSLIVLISTLNLIASLSLLIIDKKRDMSTMRSLGMESRTIRDIFFREGLLISAIGVSVGLAVGFIICFVQQTFGIVKMGSNFVVSAFPVQMRLSDFLLTFVLVMALSSLAVWFTTRTSKFKNL